MTYISSNAGCSSATTYSISSSSSSISHPSDFKASLTSGTLAELADGYGLA
jgi:hypothetical protein